MTLLCLGIYVGVKDCYREFKRNKLVQIVISRGVWIR